MANLYGQNREDATILKYVGNDPPGQVVDIGAADGELFSNSKALIDRGWKALLVEPSPWQFAKLLALHHGNPRVTLLNAAVGIETRITRFWECEGDLVSTTVESHVASWAAQGRKFRDYWVPQVTVSTILAQLGGGANVLSIDCEGTSVDILMSCPIASWVPRVVIVEHDSRIIEIVGWMRERGYVMAENGMNAENAIFVRAG